MEGGKQVLAESLFYGLGLLSSGVINFQSASTFAQPAA